MSEEKLERMEGLLTQLVTMAGNMHTVQKEHGAKLDKLETRMDSLEAKMESMESRMEFTEAKNEERHKEVITSIKRLEWDQDFIWEKTVRNERELESLKRRES